MMAVACDIGGSGVKQLWVIVWPWSDIVNTCTGFVKGVLGEQTTDRTRGMQIVVEG